MSIQLFSSLLKDRKTWVVTGAAGFIGSHLCEALLRCNQKVYGVDNFSTGLKGNILYLNTLAKQIHGSFSFFEKDIRDYKGCRDIYEGANYILHQAAIGSVPRSIVDPLNTLSNNYMGFASTLKVAAELKIEKLVYASSSSVYGDNSSSSKSEAKTGRPLSPYALSKKGDEDLAEVFSDVYGLECIGLRYFNVFGPRQNPGGPYSAVIPRWLNLLKENKSPVIFGDGLTSRDFCYIDNVVYANILAALSSESKFSDGNVFNVACGEKTSLIDLYKLLASEYSELTQHVAPKVEFQDFRKGDIKNSLAEINKISTSLGYSPRVFIREGIKLTVKSFLGDQGKIDSVMSGVN